jgi:ribosomal protein S18 acetylase RimI-like enzyme
VIVRPARTEDHDAWLAVFEAVAAEGRWIGAESPVDRTWARRSFDRAVEGRGRALLVAEAGGDVVGHASLDLAGGVADLGLVVAAPHRRRGIGAALVAAAVVHARELGAHKVTLSVWPHNEAAIGLFTRSGFVVEGRLVRHVRRSDGALWDLVLMGLPLAG